MKTFPKAGFGAIAVALWLATSSALGLEAGGSAPALVATDLEGRPVSLQANRGLVTIVDFWASWCGPCAEEMPVLEQLYQRYRAHGLRVIAVSVDREVLNARRFIESHPVAFPIVHDAGHTIADRFQPSRMPTSYVVDRSGVVRFVHAGYRAEDAAVLEAEVRQLLTQSPSR